MQKFLINTISFYQGFLSFDTGILSVFAPGGACRYPLSCSQYTKEVIEKYGSLTGVKMGLIRIWSCR